MLVSKSSGSPPILNVNSRNEIFKFVAIRYQSEIVTIFDGEFKKLIDANWQKKYSGYPETVYEIREDCQGTVNELKEEEEQK
uniref:Phage protein n=1 Tax=Strongyloides papillosus TaxID=174720 RepID=A0A0N5BUE2_STREA